MIRHATVFWVAIAGLFLTALTVVGNEVRDRDQDLAQLHAAIAREQETIHVLRAERAYLASPERIAGLAADALGLLEFDAARVTTIADLPRFHRVPDLELSPERTRPLLLSSAQPPASPTASFGQTFIPAAFLAPAGRESAGLLHETAIMTIALERAAE